MLSPLVNICVNGLRAVPLTLCSCAEVSAGGKASGIIID